MGPAASIPRAPRTDQAPSHQIHLHRVLRHPYVYHLQREEHCLGSIFDGLSSHARSDTSDKSCYYARVSSTYIAVARSPISGPAFAHRFGGTGHGHLHKRKRLKAQLHALLSNHHMSIDFQKTCQEDLKNRAISVKRNCDWSLQLPVVAASRPHKCLRRLCGSQSASHGSLSRILSSRSCLWRVHPAPLCVRVCVDVLSLGAENPGKYGG